MHVSVRQAKRRFSRLIAAAEAGDDVIITDEDGRPLVRLEPVQSRKFRLGILVGLVPTGGPDFLAPMTEDELRDWEGRSR